MSHSAHPTNPEHYQVDPPAAPEDERLQVEVEDHQENLQEEDYENMAEIEKEFAKQMGIEDEEEDDEGEEDEVIPVPKSTGGAILPSGAVPTVNGKLSQHAAEFWFPESRDCKCCHGFKYGCDCTKRGFISCQEEGCVDEPNKGKKATHQAQAQAESPRSFPSPTNPGGSQVMCKFEMAPGGCRFGAGCRFKHQNPSGFGLASSSYESHSPKGDKRIPCSYFQRGTCEFGDKCRFAHVF